MWLSVVASGAIRWPVLAVCLGGTAATAVALAWPVALPAALVLPAAAYAIVLEVDDPPLDGRAAVLAAALVVLAGLVDWSIELRTTSPDEVGGRWRRLLWIAVWGLCALALGGVLLALVDLARTEGLVVEAIGVVAALAAVGIIARLAARGRDDAA